MLTFQNLKKHSKFVHKHEYNVLLESQIYPLTKINIVSNILLIIDVLKLKY